MQNEDKKASKIKVGSFEVQNVPVYEDMIQPAAGDLGKSLATIAATIDRALLPLKGLVWSYDWIEKFLHQRLAEKLKDIPEDRIVTPDPTVAGPALEALRFAGSKEPIAEMYAQLLATAMDRSTAQKAHPGFVEILRQTTADEARIIRLLSEHDEFPVVTLHVRPAVPVSSHIPRHFSLLGIHARCEFPDMAPEYLDNLCRLGIAEIPPMTHLGGGEESPVFERIREETSFHKEKEQLERDSKKISVANSVMCVTRFGRLFCQACVERSG